MLCPGTRAAGVFPGLLSSHSLTQGPTLTSPPRLKLRQQKSSLPLFLFSQGITGPCCMMFSVLKISVIFLSGFWLFHMEVERVIIEGSMYNRHSSTIETLLKYHRNNLTNHHTKQAVLTISLTRNDHQSNSSLLF